MLTTYRLHAGTVRDHPILTFEMDTFSPEVWNLSKETQQENNGATFPMQTILLPNPHSQSLMCSLVYQFSLYTHHLYTA